MRALAEKVGALLGESVTDIESVSGGDINRAFALTLGSGRRLFAKTHAAALPQVFVREAEGLSWLAQARALRVPEVLAASDADELGPACLVLELITPGARTGRYSEAFGRGLAALHKSGASCFGHDTPNYLATLPQDNTPSDTWPRFYAERRLTPLLTQAVQRGDVPHSLAGRLRQLCERMEMFCGDPEPPARLHGDLWGGNALAAEGGEPVLIDPAVYGGHREVDLAMMQLFGGFERRVFQAYDEVYRRQPGHEERVALCQLYPLLAHVCLFGSSYTPQLERALSRYVR
ncbi:MAG TPA: fructosamine kinase family protein [Polyangiales bacterium]|nr:fructosamine kinase family protein [Polyangiales bacterium]